MHKQTRPNLGIAAYHRRGMAMEPLAVARGNLCNFSKKITILTPFKWQFTFEKTKVERTETVWKN